MNDSISREHLAYDMGYSMAVKGISKLANCYGRTNKKLAKEWLFGWEQAVADGGWGTHPDYKSK